MPLESQSFMTSIITVISSVNYRARLIVSQVLFCRSCSHYFINDNQSAVYVLGTSFNRSISPPFWGEFPFSFCFFSHWTILLASAKGNTMFLYTISSDPNMSEAMTHSDYLQIYPPTRFPSPGQKRLAKGREQQGSQKHPRNLSGCTWKGEQNHLAQRRLKSAAHTHTDMKGGKKEKRKKKQRTSEKGLLLLLLVLLSKYNCEYDQ